MTTIVILFGVGVVLLALELIVPGAVLGIVGTLAMVAGVTLAFLDFGVQGGAIASGLALLALGLTVYLEFVWLPRSRFAKAIMLDSNVTGTSQPPVADAATIIGRTATAETTLAPSGYVTVDGRRYEAFCRSGHVTAGAALRVVSVETFRLVVTPA